MWTEATVASKIQIIHCKEGNHWIVATTVNCALGIVKVYDSVFSLVDRETREVIYNLFQVGYIPPHVTMMKSQNSQFQWIVEYFQLHMQLQFLSMPIL